MIRVASFFSEAVKKEFKKVCPKPVAIQFITQLDGRVARNLQPTCKFDHLGDGVIELKINGSPAFRCVYTTKIPGRVIVLHTFAKTSEGPDHKNVKLAKSRARKL